MSLFKVFDIAGSALTAQSQRLNVVASNLANAESVTGPDGKPYKARQVTFQTAIVNNSANASTSLASPFSGNNNGSGISSSDASGVRVAGVTEDQSAGRRVYDPKHPLADGDGYLTMPNVNVVEEMVNMISASRSYQSNVEVMNTAKNLLMKTLTLGS